MLVPYECATMIFLEPIYRRKMAFKSAKEDIQQDVGGAAVCCLRVRIPSRIASSCRRARCMSGCMPKCDTWTTRTFKLLLVTVCIPFLRLRAPSTTVRIKSHNSVPSLLQMHESRTAQTMVTSACLHVLSTPASPRHLRNICGQISSLRTIRSRSVWSWREMSDFLFAFLPSLAGNLSGKCLIFSGPLCNRSEELIDTFMAAGCHDIRHWTETCHAYTVFPTTARTIVSPEHPHTHLVPIAQSS